MPENTEDRLPYVSGNVIAASAGTGKTYQLASRFLALLAMGEDPGAMVALTFTKKAAGEFRNRIFKTLAEGALNVHDDKNPDDDPLRNPLAVRLLETLSGLKLDARNSHGTWTLLPAGNPAPLMPSCPGQMGAAEFLQQVVQEHNANPETCVYPEMLCKERLGLPDNLDEKYFCSLLGSLVKASGRLSLSTLDSFFQRLVTANCFDAGLGRVQPVTGEDAKQAKLEATLALLENARHDKEGFFNLYRDVTGEKENDMLAKLQENAERYRSLFNRIKDADSWGREEAFGMGPDARAFDPGHELDYPYYLEQCSRIADAKESEVAKWTADLLNHDFNELNKKSCRCSGELVEESRMELERKTLLKTDAMFRMMAEYDRAYRESILNSGLMEFDDITELAREVLQRGDVPTETAMDLDVRLRHWMLDEFQDTNPQQWETLLTMLKDVLLSRDPAAFSHGGQDGDARKASLFVVGDTKQSIYAFRGGTPELLQGMLPDAEGKLHDVWGRLMQYSSLNQSFRSSPVIMGKEGGFVNTLFSGLASTLAAKDADGNLLPGLEAWGADAAYLESFSGHSSAKDMPGYVRVSMLPCGADDGEDLAAFDAACREIAALVKGELVEDPATCASLKGNMSVGILVRKNDEVDKLYRYLRKECGEKLPLYMVSDSFVAIGSPMGEWLLSFFLWLAHPSDVYRRGMVLESVAGSRLLDAVVQDEAGTPVQRALALAARWQNILDAKGYKAMLQQLLQEVEPTGACDAATARTWLQAAQDFDAAGGDAAAWVRFIRQRSYLGNPPEHSIQIMTMHKSKGLEFDAVVIPFIAAKAPDDTGKMQYLRNGDDILLSPGGSSQRLGIPALAELETQWKAERRKEEYNLLYVAVTRAKRALFLYLDGEAQPFEFDDGMRNHSYRQDEPKRKTACNILRALRLYGEFRTVQVSAAKKMRPTFHNETASVVLYEADGESPLYRYQAGEKPRTRPLLGGRWALPLVEKKERAAAERAAAALDDTPVAELPGRAERLRRVSPSKLAEEHAAVEAEAAGAGAPAQADDASAVWRARAADSRAATDFGTAVHACFEQVEWLEPGAPLPFGSGAASPAAAAVAAALAKPEIAALFHRPGPLVRAYNEQDVDAPDTLDGSKVWVSGIIDRLVVEYAPDGAPPVRAHIIDYKTNKMQAGHSVQEHDAVLRGHYLPQMETYRRIVAGILGLDPAAVGATLVAVPSNAPDQAHLVPVFAS